MQDECGGNSRYIAGALRFAYENRQDILDVLQAGEVEDGRIAVSDFGIYPARQFRADLVAAAEGKGNAVLQEILVERSRSTVLWLAKHGVQFLPIYERQAVK